MLGLTLSSVAVLVVYRKWALELVMYLGWGRGDWVVG